MNTIHLGDCLEIMNDIKDESIDLILCDLPYGTTNNDKDIIIPFDELWKHYKRVIKENGAIVLFAQGLFYIDLVNSNRDMFRYDLIWDKILTTGFLNANRMPLRSHEQIAVFYKKQPTYNPQFVDGEPSHSRGTKYLTKEHVNQNYGNYTLMADDVTQNNKKHPKSILSFQKPHPSKALHRTEKSIECLEWLIKTYTNEGELVLDNTAGSGTTGIASINTKRNYILIEKDEEYYEVIKKRIQSHIKPLF